MEKKMDECLIILSKRGRAVVIIVITLSLSASGRGQRPRCRGAKALWRSQCGRIRGFIAGPYCAVQRAAQYCYAAAQYYAVVQHKCYTVCLFPILNIIRRQLIKYNRQYISLIGIHYRQYEGMAFYFNNKGEIVRRYIQGKIIVNTICFQKNKPNYPYPRVQKIRPKYSVLGQYATIKLKSLNPD